MEIMKAAKALDEDLPVILVSGYPDIQGAVAAMRAGAHDYLAKPLKHHEVLRVVFRALNERDLKRKLRRLSCQIEDGASLRESMGPSERRHALDRGSRQGRQNQFQCPDSGGNRIGERPGGARHPPAQLPRREAPFMAVDCGAIPETLFESELFGHEKGAFTGADRQKIGKFEMACGGTLFLDEISNMPLGSQAKLLRVLQDKIIHRIGGTRPIDTGRPGPGRQQSGPAQAGGSEGVVPPRRVFPAERIRHHGSRLCASAGKTSCIWPSASWTSPMPSCKRTCKASTKPAVDALLAYHWPGNVRQLRSMIRRAVLLAEDIITEQHLAIEGARPHERSADPAESPPGVQIPCSATCS